MKSAKGKAHASSFKLYCFSRERVQQKYLIKNKNFDNISIGGFGFISFMFKAYFNQSYLLKPLFALQPKQRLPVLFHYAMIIKIKIH